ncbi:MAG: hypothetical protein KA072_12250 [Thermoanaerobaculaceae bacterium]|nr:hypothetical protein [Thermoanaerobaculaceae bacterium]MDI9622258.1 hypothetical protein [Acidobacteriota bacterium]NLH11876.1 hypothetical protein [Holophagae bacterium]HPW56309.1 hypothetical protein [Thermoanaerobaculaceae bacterium]
MTSRMLIIIRVLWVVATAALMAVWNVNAWVFLLVLPALGPLLREVAPAPDLDERQRLLDYRASHYALIVSYLVLFALFARSWFQLKQEPPVELWLLIVAPLVVRVVISVVQGYGGRKMALILGFVCGSLWLAFSTVSHGVSPESAIGLGLIAFTAIGIRWPNVGGVLLILAALACIVFLIPIGYRNTGRDIIVGAVLLLTLPLPLVLAGVGLIVAALRAKRVARDDFVDMRPTA